MSGVQILLLVVVVFGIGFATGFRDAARRRK